MKLMEACGFDWQEYIRRQLEEEQRHLEILQQQLLHEQAMLLVSACMPTYNENGENSVISIIFYTSPVVIFSTAPMLLYI